MINFNRYASPTAFTDLLFNIVIGVAFMFMLAFLLINPVAKKQDIESKADFLIILNWDTKSFNDLDLWMRDPLENTVSFRNKDNGLMHLDRDDLGRSNDTQYVPGVGKVTYPYNREITTIRGYVPGEYVLNIHMYRKMVKDTGNQPVPVTITLEKINPKVKLIWQGTLILEGQWQEKTAIRFVLNRDGEVKSTSFIYFPLVKRQIRQDATAGLTLRHPGDEAVLPAVGPDGAGF